MEVKVFDQKGKEIGKVKLNEAIFGVEPNEELIHQALVRQLAHRRQANAHSKTRGEVSGSTRKLYRQKGTGRARRGSKKAHILIGGGVAFGPRNDRNYTKLMPKKQRRTALFGLLSSKVNGNNVLVLDKYEDKDMKTKNFALTLSKLPVDRDALIVSDRANKELMNRVSGNLPNAKTVMTQYLNMADLLKYKTVIFLKDSLAELESTFLTTSE